MLKTDKAGGENGFSSLLFLETVSYSVGAAWGVQGSPSRLRDENFLEKQETCQTAKHIAAEQGPALS